jgi:hypothetical protein
MCYMYCGCAPTHESQGKAKSIATHLSLSLSLTHTHIAHTTQTQHTHTFCILSYLRVVIENTRVPILRCSSFFILVYLCQILCIDFSYPLLIFSPSPSLSLSFSLSLSLPVFVRTLPDFLFSTHSQQQQTKKAPARFLYTCV